MSTILAFLKETNAQQVNANQAPSASQKTVRCYGPVKRVSHRPRIMVTTYIMKRSKQIVKNGLLTLQFVFE